MSVKELDIYDTNISIEFDNTNRYTINPYNIIGQEKDGELFRFFNEIINHHKYPREQVKAFEIDECNIIEHDGDYLIFSSYGNKLPVRYLFTILIDDSLVYTFEEIIRIIKKLKNLESIIVHEE